MLDVRVVYHHFPHYRAPVIREMNKSVTIKYTFFGGHENYAGIKSFNGDSDVKIENISFCFDEKTGRMAIHNYRKVFFGRPDAIILIGNPNIYATWLIALEARLRGIRVAFWAHGWLRPESKIKSLLRNFYFNLADIVLVYGKRAKKIGVASGFSDKKIHEIFNSLNWDLQTVFYEKYKNTKIEDLRASIKLPVYSPVFACISRITDICHYDWLISAAALLNNSHPECIILMIGEGPARPILEELAKQKNVNLRCVGAIYDEEMIARYLMAADAVVSPGKVGLTAMHSLAYGTPVITHGEFNLQMPEVEAIIPQKTGDFFSYGNVQELRDALDRLISDRRSIDDRRLTCRQVIEKFYTPKAQAALIDAAMTRICNV